MKQSARFIFHLGKCLWGPVTLIGFGAACHAAADSSVPASFEYHDRVIGGGSLVPDMSNGDADTTDGGGLARSLQVDGVVSALGARSGTYANNVVENGVVARSQWDTMAFGAWSLDAAARTGGSGTLDSEQGQGGTVTLRQRGMPFDGGWTADNGLGDLNAPDINLARQQPRFFLPTATIEGLTSEWHGPSGLQIVASGGVPGQFEGIVVPNFHALQGSTATLGAQGSPAEPWNVGAQLIDAHSTNLAVGAVTEGGALQSSTAGLLSAGWAEHGDKLQFNLLEGNVAGKGDGIGVWVDGAMTLGHAAQSAGVFRIDPHLNWGNQLISNDMEGGYYRFNYHTRQWMADVGVDEVHSVSGLGSDITFLTGDARYQLSRDSGAGGVVNVSHSTAETNWSLEGYLDHTNRWGVGRAQADVAHASAAQDLDITLDEAWETTVGVRLSTSASIERINGTVLGVSRQDSTLAGLGLVGGGQLTASLNLEANVHWTRAVQGIAAPGVSAALSLTYSLAPDWQILATYYDSRSGAWTSLSVVSPLTPPLAATVPTGEQRGVFLTLRYKRAAGLHFAPLGGAPGSGAGEVAGTVYLDANNNGQLDAGEGGAANVTVVLDGRFSLRTDANGRFDFPAVAAGTHVITVISDNVPLPWILVNDGRAQVVVATRGRVNVDLAAERAR